MREKYVWEGWEGKRIVRMVTLEDGDTQIEIEDGRIILVSVLVFAKLTKETAQVAEL
jgi:hypothetical protein